MQSTNTLDADRSSIDWDLAERSPAFRELVTRRHRFIAVAVTVALGWFLVFLALATVAKDLGGRSIYEGLTVAYVVGLSQYFVVWGLALMYLRRSSREYEPLERQAAEEALDRARKPAPPSPQEA
jgi:uncharacterized membrane protein (DUF485 family)